MANKNIKILYVLNKCPYPLFDGTRERILGEIKFLGKEYTLDLLIITTEKITKEQLDYLTQCTAGKVFVFHINKITAYNNALSGLFSQKPIQSVYFRSKKAHNWLIENAHKYQSIYFHTIRNGKYIEYLKKYHSCPDTKICLSFNDAISLNYKRAKEKATGIWRFIYTIEESRVKKYELTMLKMVDGASIVSQEDKNYILGNWQECFANEKAPSINVIRNGLDDAYINYVYTGEKSNLVFFGNLLYPPNRQGLEYFTQKIWPELLKLKPETKLLIIGRGGDIFKNIKNAEVLGFVEDPYELMCEQSVLINPINFGAGVPTKVLVAMAIGLPVVAYQEGIAGIENVTDEDNIMLVEPTNPSSAASRICALLDSKLIKNKISQNGRKLILDKYLASKNLPYLGELLALGIDTTKNP